jgi:hypothetical protein
VFHDFETITKGAPTMPATTTYRARKISDPRSRGACYWFEIEATAPDGSRHHVATCDDRHEARELVRQLKAAEAAKSAAAEKNS